MICSKLLNQLDSFRFLSTTKELKKAENEGGLAKNSHEAKEYLHRNDPEQSEDEEADEEGSEEEESDESSEDEEAVDAQKLLKQPRELLVELLKSR